MKKSRLLGAVFLLVALSILKVGNAAEYEITDLGTLGGNLSYGRDLNNKGQVVGFSNLTSNGVKHGFIGEIDNGLVDVGSLSGQSYAYGLNNNGLVVGQFEFSGPGQLHAHIWDSAGGMRDLGTLGGLRSVAYDLNDAGSVVGHAEPQGSNFSHAFVWDSVNGMRDLGTFGGAQSLGYHINEDGYVVGGSTYQVGNTAYTPFIWDPTTEDMEDLGSLGGTAGVAYALNDAGIVVGESTLSDESGHAFIWDPAGGIRGLGTLGGNYSNAQGINNSVQVVGLSRTMNGLTHAFIWDEESGMRDLNDLIPAASGWELTFGHEINDDGQIVGFGEINGVTHAFLMTPIPKAIEDLLIDLRENINAILDVSFKNNAGKRRNALFNKIDAVIESLAVADTETDPFLQDELYQEAIDKLQNDIQSKMDGCLGGGANNDWVVDGNSPACPVQGPLNKSIDDVVQRVTELIV